MRADDTADLLDESLSENTRLRRDVEFLRDALERMPIGLSAFDEHDRLLLANALYCRIWGLPAELIVPGTPFEQIMRATPGRETPTSRRHQPLPGSEGTRVREWQLDDGRIVQVTVSRRADGSCVALHEDVTAQREASARIHDLARNDQLTGLPNRTVLRDELERALAANRRGEPLALLLLDLDRFKPVNDTYGHAVGDALLEQVAQRLRETLRETDFVARLGGDEFAVVQRGGLQPDASVRLARRIIDAMAEPFLVHEHVLHIGVSVGIALASADGTNLEALQRHADLALYRAKSDGRGTLRFFESAMNDRIEARRGLESDLREAIAQDQLSLAYQPRFDLQDGTAVGVEALLRWQHPRRGAVSPADFVPLAEETGLIVPIGRWVLEAACKAATRWPRDVPVAVNLSPAQLVRACATRDAEAALAATGLPAWRLELELTESAMLRHPASALDSLHALSAKGVRFAMDDFGTGYSSLAHLRSFPFHHLKIDRSFVRDVCRRPDLRAIVHGVATMARGLNMKTTAEGVETDEQLGAVASLGCDAAQGFLLGRPMSAAQLELVLKAPPALAHGQRLATRA